MNLKNPFFSMRPIVLATASPARRKLLSDANIPYTACSANIDETPLRNESAESYVKRIALKKMDAITEYPNDAIIITVDTAIECEGHILGKPSDETDARHMLLMLSGNFHRVVSAICVRNTGNERQYVETISTDVKFANLSNADITWYLSTGEWKNRAGGYAIQGKGTSLVDEIHGSITNVIGISITSLKSMLKKLL